MSARTATAARWIRRVRTHLTVLWAIAAALVSACGDSTTPTAPGPSPTAPGPSPDPSFGQFNAAALRLYEAAAVHANLTASPLVYAVFYGDQTLWTSGPCSNGGSLQTSLDGVLPAKGTVLPPGSHNLAVTFADCVVDQLVGISLNGAASAVYTSSTDLNELTALVSVNSMRATGEVGFLSPFNDVTADGSGTWTRERRDEWRSTTTYSPTIGSRLVNNLTNNVATFGGGSYSTIQHEPPSGSSSQVQHEYNNLAVAINGTDYVLSGNILSTYGFGGSASDVSHSGEVRITSNGTLVARVYGTGGPDARGLTALRVEVFFPLVLL